MASHTSFLPPRFLTVPRGGAGTSGLRLASTRCGGPSRSGSDAAKITIRSGMGEASCLPRSGGLYQSDSFWGCEVPVIVSALTKLRGFLPLTRRVLSRIRRLFSRVVGCNQHLSRGFTKFYPSGLHTELLLSHCCDHQCSKGLSKCINGFMIKCHQLKFTPSERLKGY